MKVFVSCNSPKKLGRLKVGNIFFFDYFLVKNACFMHVLH